jgi:hypothetical protein
MIGYSIPRLEVMRVLFHGGDVDACVISILGKQLADKI